ncbi:unnamed protein product [Timema podura]|uniref:Uncharacterized protein n=1 Tax=Timema podura TaxID=61482 RepID=A0ABN7NU73_TIMPD|nr:unnamed protein product [Timema podura]
MKYGAKNLKDIDVLVSVIPQVQLALYVVLSAVHVSVNLMWLVVPVIAVLQELMVLDQKVVKHVIATLLVPWTTSVIPKLVSVNVVLIHTVENVTNVNQDFGIFQTVNAVNVMDLLTLVTHEQELAFNAKILHLVTTVTGVKMVTMEILELVMTFLVVPVRVLEP